MVKQWCYQNMTYAVTKNQDLLKIKKCIEMHLKQPGFTFSVCGPFTKKEFKNLKNRRWDTNYIYKNEFDKACFQYHMAYGDFKDLTRRTASDKILRDKVFNIAKNPKYDRFQRELDSLVYKFLIKNPQVVVLICVQINLLLIMKITLNYTNQLLKKFKK